MSKTNQYYRYPPISPRDREWGLYVTGAGWRDATPNSAYPPRDHIHPPSHALNWSRGRKFHEYAVVYVSDGRGEFESKETGRVAVEPGTAMLLFPEVWHRFRPSKETGWREHWVTFHGDMAARMHRNGFLRPETPVLDVGVDDGILLAFKSILNRLQSETVGFQQVIAAETLGILAAILAAERSRRAVGHVSDLVRRAKAAIEEHVETLPVIEDLAESLGVSAGHLRRVFKQYTGFSPYQYHLQLKVSRAKTMLRESDLPIKHIAKRLGFQNVHHFSKLFKKVTDMPPHRWRNGSKTAEPADSDVSPANRISVKGNRS